MSRIGDFRKRTFEKMENVLIIILLCNVTALCKGGSLHLFSSPPTATDGGLFTLVCTNRSRGISGMKWYLNDNQAFTTKAEGAKETCSLGIPSSSPIKYKDRFTVSCNDLQHNVTLTINSTIDNGSVWYCEDNTVTGTRQVTRLKSNKFIINVTTSIWTYGSSTSSTTFGPSDLDNSSTDTQNNAPNVVYIAVGAAMGGVVVSCVITAIVVWMRRNSSTEDNATAPNIYTSPSHYEDMEHEYGKAERQYVNTVEVSGSGSPDSVNTEDQAGNAAYYNTTGQHQHLDEHANTGDTTYYNTVRDADN
ncbi:uncharacterized protein [Haliotis cracherodii]|uniref:uncharacterized protein n=1 Tax=Haliotis cracherodii TaxID=6455 RepID=UPI0039ED526C